MACITSSASWLSSLLSNRDVIQQQIYLIRYSRMGQMSFQYSTVIPRWNFTSGDSCLLQPYWAPKLFPCNGTRTYLYLSGRRRRNECLFTDHCRRTEGVRGLFCLWAIASGYNASDLNFSLSFSLYYWTLQWFILKMSGIFLLCQPRRTRNISRYKYFYLKVERVAI